MENESVRDRKMEKKRKRTIKKERKREFMSFLRKMIFDRDAMWIMRACGTEKWRKREIER